MSFFFRRRREPIHERLAREGGMPLEWQPRLEPTGVLSGPDSVGIHGLHRLREWDVTVLAEAPELSGDEVLFVGLPGGDLVLERAPDDADLAPLADAVERELQPPYRARAVRRDETRWAVAARSLELLALPGADGDELELAVRAGEISYRVDGRPAFGGRRELESLRMGDYAVRATRLDGDLFELDVSPL